MSEWLAELDGGHHHAHHLVAQHYLPRSWAAAPAITKRGNRCSSRGWLSRAEGAFDHCARWASRAAGSSATVLASQESKRSECKRAGAVMNPRATPLQASGACRNYMFTSKETWTTTPN